MNMLFMIVVTIVTLSILVSFHEFGHYWVARRCGVKVLRFSIGFGKPFWSYTNKEGVEFALAPIPLGGYVKMLDEREGDVDPDELHRAFNQQPPAKRIAIAAAGPIANFILAIFVYWLVFLQGTVGLVPRIGDVKPDSIASAAGLEAGQEIVAVDGRKVATTEALHLALLDRIGETGELQLTVKAPNSDLALNRSLALQRWLSEAEEPDVLAGLGLELWRPEVQAIVNETLPDGPAAAAGFLSGDKVLEADGLEIRNWADWVDIIQQNPGRSIEITVERNGSLVDLQITPARKVNEEGVALGYAGVSATLPEWPKDMLRTNEYGVVSAFGAAVDRTQQMTLVTLNAIKKLITGLLSPKNLSGPISIAKVAGASAEYGFVVWLGFLAFFSVNLAVLNLLPIPVLDGGHICYGLFELLTGKPVTEGFQIWANQVGMMLVLAVMVIAVYNDILRL